MANQIGLRERRRRQTSTDIRDAAMRLTQERGWDKVTIEEICIEAGISTRTFFNYFPNKESAIAYGPSDIPAELGAEFVAAGPAPYSVVLAELITLVAHHLRDMPPKRDQAACMLELGKWFWWPQRVRQRPRPSPWPTPDNEPARERESVTIG